MTPIGFPNPGSTTIEPKGCQKTNRYYINKVSYAHKNSKYLHLKKLKISLIFEIFSSLLLKVLFFSSPFSRRGRLIPVPGPWDINTRIILSVLVSRMCSGLRLTWILVIAFILIFRGSKRCWSFSKWHRCRPGAM